MQGKLGNCGFGSLIAICNVYPKLIKNLFLFPKINDNLDNNSISSSSLGLCEIKLCHNGIWRQYTIDDLIPCNYSGRAAFTKHSNCNILWVSLIEKCVAKAYGG